MEVAESAVETAMSEVEVAAAEVETVTSEVETASSAVEVEASEVETALPAEVVAASLERSTASSDSWGLFLMKKPRRRSSFTKAMRLDLWGRSSHISV